LVDRLPLDAIVHRDEYDDKSESRIKEYYNFKENLPASQQFVEENSKENLAQVYAEVRYKSTDNVFFSKKLIKYLEEQGFDFAR